MSTAPSLWAVARRPLWIGALILALAVAASFAALGQWQLSRSVESAVAPDQQTENIVPLTSVAQPQSEVLPSATGQLVTFTGDFAVGEYVVLSGRVNFAEPGYWVVGRAVAPDGVSLAVALGWAPTADAAASVIASLEQSPPSNTLTGRYLPSESPQQSEFERGERTALSVGELVNLWAAPADGSFDGVYGGYLVLRDAIPGLERIDSPAPSAEVSLNVLNIFYAVEWALFAGFAIFLWYRLVKDAWEAEIAELETTPAAETAIDPTADKRKIGA